MYIYIYIYIHNIYIYIYRERDRDMYMHVSHRGPGAARPPCAMAQANTPCGRPPPAPLLAGDDPAY